MVKQSRRFHVMIERDEDGVYIAHVPALPGCVSDGVTAEDALRNVGEAIDLWLEAEDMRAIDVLPEDQRQALQVA